jgi:phosphosulfolactate synthase (CoM biosynthesis protein A)
LGRGFFPFIGKVKKLGFDQLEINGGTFANMSKGERQRLVDEARRCGTALSWCGCPVPKSRRLSAGISSD